MGVIFAEGFWSMISIKVRKFRSVSCLLRVFKITNCSVLQIFFSSVNEIIVLLISKVKFDFMNISKVQNVWGTTLYCHNFSFVDFFTFEKPALVLRRWLVILSIRKDVWAHVLCFTKGTKVYSRRVET